MEPPRKKPRSSAPPSHASLTAGKDFRKKVQQEAPIDSSIYDYDSAYDAMQSAKESLAAAAATASKHQGSKYMGAILDATERRRLDQLRARDRILAAEREAEGDAFKDKDRFVTGAYKEQQEESRRAEEEERCREREEESRKRKEGAGMRGFYKDLLGAEEERHRAMVQGAAEMGREGIGKGQREERAEEKTDLDRARELNERGANVVINDDGQVADKRQLLAGGLNIVAKKKATTDSPSGLQVRKPPEMAFHAKGAGGEQARRERQTRMLEAQLEEASRKVAEEEAAEQRKRDDATKSKKTKEEIGSAKERYLARKRAAEAEKAAQKG